MEERKINVDAIGSMMLTLVVTLPVTDVDCFLVILASFNTLVVPLPLSFSSLSRALISSFKNSDVNHLYS